MLDDEVSDGHQLECFAVQFAQFYPSLKFNIKAEKIFI